MRIKERFQAFMHNEALKKKLYIIIFESDTPLGKTFDVALMWCIILSILLIFVESMQGIPAVVKPFMVWAEYLFTAFFTIEYLTRLYCAPKPKEYAFSFFGIVDLLATLPFYISWIFGGARYLMIIRTFRLIRVFRVFKLFSFLNEGNILLRSLILSSRKIMVFFLFVVIIVISIGTIMYMIEGDLPDSSFHNIPESIYWAIVTLTTVGYGDITPATPLGQFLSAVVMLLGYTIMAVPTGIVSATMIKESGTSKVSDDNENLDDEIVEEMSAEEDIRICRNCGRGGHDQEAIFCKYCGERL